eukprot:TRINITY_DN66512_c0_g1_i1.p1 TRINITY_DN66512_c0_g1~~TRINITY_DN66512_c0_g1_i1.p1  ORF type:complete len:288 (-),score=14.68 TRINITY_DN66512_c0_g1_i1:35-898(-)
MFDFSQWQTVGTITDEMISNLPAITTFGDLQEEKELLSKENLTQLLQHLGLPAALDFDTVTILMALKRVKYTLLAPMQPEYDMSDLMKQMEVMNQRINALNLENERLRTNNKPTEASSSTSPPPADNVDLGDFDTAKVPENVQELHNRFGGSGEFWALSVHSVIVTLISTEVWGIDEVALFNCLPTAAKEEHLSAVRKTNFGEKGSNSKSKIPPASYLRKMLSNKFVRWDHVAEAKRRNVGDLSKPAPSFEVVLGEFKSKLQNKEITEVKDRLWVPPSVVAKYSKTV